MVGRRAWWALLPLGVGLLVTAWAVRAVRSALEREAAQTFNSGCDALEARVEVCLRAHEQVLRSAAAFFADSDGVSREEWHEFAERQKVSQRLPGIQGIGFVLLVPSAHLAAHVSSVRGEGFPGYRVWPEGARDIYSSVVFIEPFAERNLHDFGHDMLTEAVLRSAMEQARDEDATVLSGKTALVQEDARVPQIDTLMYAPVYRMGEPRATPAQRQAAIMGWVYSPYWMNDLLEGFLEHRNLAGAGHIDLQIYDGADATPAAMLYDSEGGSRAAPARTPAPARRQTAIIAAGRLWLLSFAETGAGPDDSTVWLVWGGGTLTSLLLASLVLSLITTHANAGALARRLNQDLRQSEERWKFALEGAGDGIWDWSVRGGDVYYSDRAKEMLGYAAAESSDTFDQWDSLVYPGDQAAVAAARDAHLADPNVAYACEFRMKCEDGSWKWILSRGQVVRRDVAGRPLRMIGTHKDVSERKQSEARIARLSAIQVELTHLASTFINVPVEEHDAAIDKSLAAMGRLIEVDRAKLFEYDFAAGIVRNTHEWCAPGETPQLGDLQEMSMASAPDWVAAHRRGEAVILSNVDVLPAASPLRRSLDAHGIRALIMLPLMQGGTCQGFLGFESLHSERIWRAEEEALLLVLAELYANFEAHSRMERGARELQLRLMEASTAAHAAAQAKGQFLANMSHEIRTPLNAILGYAQIMQHECRGCEYRDRLSGITRGGEHLLTLVTDLLDLVRSDARPLEPTLADFDFYRVLEDVRLMFVVHPDALGVSLELFCDPAVPRFVRSDPVKLRQTLVNLLGNALKFTDSGRVRLAASLLPGADPGALLIAVDVEDTGCGIEHDELEQIFDVFGQAEAGRRSGKGTGLGLPLSRRYARALGGDITVVSSPGQGSHFRLTFRAGLAHGDGDAQNSGRQVLRLVPGQASRRVLVVDDDAENRAMLAAMLSAVGFGVAITDSGPQALQQLQETGGIDLVLIDQRMPEMSGFETIRQMHERCAGRRPAVLMVTASACDEDKAQAFAVGADGFLSKPLRRGELFDEIGRLLELRYEYGLLPAAAGASAASNELDAAAVACLPAAQRLLLARAVRSGDIRRMRELLGAIGREHAGLATQLGVLVNAYAYGRLSELLDVAEGTVI